MTPLKPMNRLLHLSTALATAVLLAACAATYSPASIAPGTPEAEVRRALGEPTGEYPGPEGSRRLEYAKGPVGLHTFMVDIGADGKMLKWQQVLDKPNFASIRVGMSREELLYRLGRPADISTLPFQNRTVYGYRFDATFCQWFQVKLNPRGEVVGTDYTRDPDCASRDQ